MCWPKGASPNVPCPSIDARNRRLLLAVLVGEQFTAISRANSKARGKTSSGSQISEKNPACCNSSAGMKLAFKIHSLALANPTKRGRNQLAAPSKTMPRRAKGKAYFALLDPIRISIGQSIVAPIPTAAPLTAAIIGVSHSKTARFKMPPASRIIPSCVTGTLSTPELPKPSLISAPAQKARPAPVKTITRTDGSASPCCIASSISSCSAIL